MTDDRFWVGPATAPETYQLVTCLGGGAEGEVWAAVLPLSAGGQRDVAVKILPAHANDDEEAWTNHGHLLQSISHPGLVRVLQSFVGPVRHRRGDHVDDTARYVVMDLVKGVSLREWLDDNPDATVSQRLKALTTVAAALDEMHSGTQTRVAVAHGDVKPSNIIIRPDKSTVLVDLGLIRLADGTGRSGRSRPYAAPELFEPGARTTAEADRFAFAATVAHVLLGEPPPTVANGGPDLAAVQARLQASPAAGRRPILIRSIMEALASSPQQRPGSLRLWLSSLTDALSQVTDPLGGVAATATLPSTLVDESATLVTTATRPPTAVPATSRGTRRWPLRWLLAGATLTVALSVTIAITVNYTFGQTPPTSLQDPTGPTIPAPNPAGSPSPNATSGTTSPTATFGPPVTQDPSGSPVQVTLGELCNAPKTVVYICGTDYGGTIEVGNEVFTYSGRGNGFSIVKPPNWGRILEFPANTCSKLIIQFAARERGTGKANLRVIQSDSPPTTASTDFGTIGTLSADLNGSPFYLQYNTTSGDPVYADGYALCLTPSGQ